MATADALLGDAAVARLFGDSAEIRAMLLVEGALARVQGAAGIIPLDAAAMIDRATREVQIDPASLAAQTRLDGVPIPALLAAFRKAVGPCDYLHWGATSQDIIDTGLALRLRRVLDIWQDRLGVLLPLLADLAARHAETPMAARSYGQYATPTTFGAVVAGWGWPIGAWADDLPALRGAVQLVSLSGAAGTSAALGPDAARLRADLAAELDLFDPGHSWHSDRSGLSRLAGFAAGLAASLAKFGEDVLTMTQSGIAEITMAGGGSSTMPQKQNPVAASALVALGRHCQTLAHGMQTAGIHKAQRDGAAWFTEWLTLPQLCISLGRALDLAGQIAAQITPDLAAMQRPLDQGLIHAEAVTFALAQSMPRPQAAALVKTLCETSLQTGENLLDLVARHQPDWPGLNSDAILGQAPAEARAFAARYLVKSVQIRV